MVLTLFRLGYDIGVKFSLAAILLLAYALTGCNSHPHGIGSLAPDFTVQDSDRKVSLHQLQGKPVLLNFWGTFCAPCVEEMPSLVQLQKRLGPNVTVLAVSVDTDEKAYHRFLKEYNIDLLTVRDPEQKTPILYGTSMWPETYAIDGRGVIRRKFFGAVNWTDPNIVEYLKSL